jgi:hypothetical protein
VDNIEIDVTERNNWLVWTELFWLRIKISEKPLCECGNEFLVP